MAATIVRPDGRMLLTQRRDNGAWEPPGGVLELAEDIHAGVRREVREETGLEFQVERLTGVYKNMTLGVVALMFRGQTTGGTLTLNDEVQDFRWIRPAEAQAVLTEVFAVRVLDALEGPDVQVRAHDGRQVLPADASHTSSTSTSSWSS
ncbi:NUDIX hydrolase [Amycolatopsis sp. PS_44_ISF1]|uniref:NUDIX hydrolase n=1 Tax=Amycolatopsis sp. PS_44_ISF1 TaxID=2974917 RepID=UPI0028DD8DA6|nr:NUDIX hydrolase [Amycolatopsis sp. PS_44_ISF1]MDT8912257.1 NUDIX hydrolase [Amycolatopsis sp. PS_44_ISF1]